MFSSNFVENVDALMYG